MALALFGSRICSGNEHSSVNRRTIILQHTKRSFLATLSSETEVETPLTIDRSLIVPPPPLPPQKCNSGSTEHRNSTIQNPPAKRAHYYVYLGGGRVLNRGSSRTVIVYIGDA